MMNRKAVTIVLALGLIVAGVAALRTINRADAAGGDCYSADQGPSTPTVCN